MCCLTTSLTPLLWICDMSGLTISPISLLCIRLPIVVWLQAHRHYCEFVPQVLSDYKHIATVVSLCHRCCLTTGTSPLLWVCATGVVWLQAHRHCCEFVPQVLSDYKHIATVVSLCHKCCPTTSLTPLLWICDVCVVCIRLPIVVWPLLWVRSQSVVQPTLCPTPLLKVHT
jgi:hypothetical protein